MRGHLSVIKTVFTAIIYLMVAMVAVNCSPLEISELSSFDSFNSKYKIDPDCMTNGRIGSCVFLKSPVAYYDQAIYEDDLINSLIVVNADTHIQGALENSSVMVRSAIVPPSLLSSNEDWKFFYSEQEGSRLGQVNSYFWATEIVKQFGSKHSEGFMLKDKNIQIVTDSRVSGWSSEANSIYLKSNFGVQNHSYDAGLLAHFLAEANLFYATKGKIYNLSVDSNHKDCRAQIKSGSTTKNVYFKKDCCTSKMGCSKAIAAGQADYMAALVFESSPTVGEGITNNPDGLSTCGLTRNLSKNVNLTSNKAYEACSEYGMNGQVYAMGSLYASVWWRVRGIVKDNPKLSVDDLDKLFFAHLKEIEGRDNFQTILAKIKKLDAELFNKQYSQLFQAVYNQKNI